VYTGGAILASKRSPYDDLIASGFDQGALAERLDRQHKLICAAVHAGRIEELKRMGERAGAVAEPAQQPQQTNQPDPSPAELESEPPRSETPAVERFSISEQADDPLLITLLNEQPLRAGESVTLRLEVTRKADEERVPAAKANITLKVLGSTFQPSSTYSTTDSSGRSAISVALPNFKTGRGAILIRAQFEGEVAELRRIVDPS